MGISATSQKLLFRFKILLHHASTNQILVCHAFFAVNALVWIDIVVTADYRYRTRSAKGFAFQALAAGIEFPNLVSNHSLDFVVVCDIHRPDFYGMFISVLAKWLD